MAARVQKALLPQAEPGTDRVRTAWRYRPCEKLAGDSLDVFMFDDRYVGVYVLDVSGHGTQAALLSVAVTHTLSRTVRFSAITCFDHDGFWYH